MEVDMEKAVVMGSFDDLRSSDIRFLEEAARRGELHVYLWSDELVRKLDGHPPKFPQPERLYLLQAIRYVNQVHLVDQLADQDSLPTQVERYTGTWLVYEKDDNDQKGAFCASNGLKYQVIKPAILKIFPKDQMNSLADKSHNINVVVTGCYDWLHSGHVRFFEEVSELGDLYVVAGSDKNVQLLKGKDHPMFPQDERRYVVQAIRFVKQALISSGSGWMDAEPEIERIKPDIYAVNEDGDVPEKRSFCEAHGIQYVVLKRTPKEGLPKRQSVDLRGF
jgi:cytidyltransferase-like protein